MALQMLVRTSLDDDNVAWITKNDPDQGNAMSLAMAHEFEVALAGLRDVRAVVIGAAGNGFHGPAALVTDLADNVSELDAGHFAQIVAIGRRIGDAITALPIPVLGLAPAGAIGGGLEILMRCDFVFCTDAARFKLPETAFGFVAAWGGTQHAARMMHHRRAQELLLLGRTFRGTEAAEMGLVTRSFADAAGLDQHVANTLDRLRHISPAAYAATKRALAAAWSHSLGDGLAIEGRCQAEAMGSGEFIAGVAAAARRNAYDYIAGVEVSGESASRSGR